MSTILGLLLVSQLTYFEFTPLGGDTFYAGDSFGVTIYARDPYGGTYNYTGGAVLSTTKDGYWSYVRPDRITFVQGVWQGRAMVTLAESLKLRCVEPNSGVSGESNLLVVYPGAPDRFITLLPGEAMAAGTEQGRLPDPPVPQLSGDSFTVRVMLTDVWHNTSEQRNDSFYVSATDSFAQVPSGGQVSGGIGSFAATIRRAGSHNIVVRPATGSPVKPGTSSTFAVGPGPFENLLVLLPGETPLPGDNASLPWQTPGKAGTPAVQALKGPFKVTVYACDGCWNPVNGPGDTIALASDFSVGVSPGAAPLFDSVPFTVHFNTAGENQNVWAWDRRTLLSYRTLLDIRALAKNIEILSSPDTVRAGATAILQVALKDVNSEPVVAALCRFSVIAGSGEMLDSAVLSDTVGLVSARFFCSATRGAERDTIRVTADTFALIDIYVDMPDRSLAEGKINCFPNPFGFNKDQVEISYYLQRSCNVNVRIYDPFGNEVISRDCRQGAEGGEEGVNRVYWDGRNSKGRRVANGVYLVEVVGSVHTGSIFKNAQRIGVVW